jgi:hypothetical protein
MSQATHTPALIQSTPSRPPLRLALLAAATIGAAIGLAATLDPGSPQAVADAGAELTRLLRAMAAIKLVLAAGVVWLIDWRLRFPVSPHRAAAYIAATAIMATGPGLIWAMSHIVLGAALLHGASATLLVLLYRDPGSPAMAWAACRTR